MVDVKDKRLSLRAAAKFHGIPRSTLHDHISGRRKKLFSGGAPILTPAEENRLADWIIGSFVDLISSIIKHFFIYCIAFELSRMSI